MSISFNIEDQNFTLKSKLKIRSWIIKIINLYSKKSGSINFIFVSINEIIEINNTYLKHYYPTDIITFDYCTNNIISGDIFICSEIVFKNSVLYNTTREDEMNRVIIHGILHLIGFNDSSEQEQLIMRSKEDEALNIFKTSQF